ncbi:hypothetical protein Acid345_0433 [Candidatus Koribacter versatilis Ellin345]|uniref:Uncharacterized protein n=2 Tax=Candidatus Korobacter versatilis TaxID=658062 RepID=Q1IUL2_KORVE|nr:hypothetical protein Acid345_0433 [Candidatus Koribacter versatilis Ellin345]
MPLSHLPVYRSLHVRRVTHIVLAMFVLSCFTAPHLVAGTRKDIHESPNALQVLVNAPLKDVIDAVQQVSGDTVIYGTQSYQREKNLMGARRAESSKAFGDAAPAGTVIYKIAEGVLAPTNFKNTADMGTITVRYVVSRFDEKNTNVRIDAVFIENSSKHVHESDGSVEAAEFGEIRQRVEQIMARHETDRMEAERIARERNEKQAELDLAARQEAAKAAAAAPIDLEQRVVQLRRKAELRVKASGTQLKSAPYKGAASLQSLSPYTDVVVLIVTPFWYGVQTADGHRGWVYHAEVENLP